MTDSMLERATEAAMVEVRRQLGMKPIPGDLGLGNGWSSMGDPGSLEFSKIVRAVIEAMREPTEAMKAMHWTEIEYSGADTAAEKATNVWQWMIDAALKETP
jgi:hypothetical protein